MYIKKSRVVISVVVIFVISSILTACILNPFGAENFGKYIKFICASKLINNMYYEDVDKGEAAEAAISGVASSKGDPYTAYFWGDLAKEYLEDIKGDYCGVGIYIEKDSEENLVSVVLPIVGGSAENAGIKRGDKILAVDGKYFTGDELSEVSSAMRGEEGTSVNVLIREYGSGKEREVVLTRKRILLDSVNGKMIDSETGYIGITQFTEGSSDEFAKEINELSKNGMKSLIIDLRNNPGGLLNEAVDIVSCFVDDGKVVAYTEDKNGKRTEYHANKRLRDTVYEIPIILLVNDGSASASEIMTGALKDYGMAKVVGQKTYGKGIVQSVLNIGKDVLSVTTSRYFTPNGVCIHGEGITPDVVVEMSPQYCPVTGNIDLSNDIQLLTAIDIIRK